MVPTRTAPVTILIGKKKIFMKVKVPLPGLDLSSKIRDSLTEILSLIMPWGASVVLVDLDVMTLVVIQLISTGLE